MIAVHILAGDGNGGPYAHATLTLDRDSGADVTDAECAEWREAIRKMYHDGFSPHEDPEQIIVYIDEVPDVEAA